MFLFWFPFIHCVLMSFLGCKRLLFSVGWDISSRGRCVHTVLWTFRKWRSEEVMESAEGCVDSSLLSFHRVVCWVGAEALQDRLEEVGNTTHVFKLSCSLEHTLPWIQCLVAFLILRPHMNVVVHTFLFCVHQVKQAAQQDGRPGPEDVTDGSCRQDLSPRSSATALLQHFTSCHHASQRQ